MSEKMRVVVTGSSGRIGRHVVRELLERGHDVISVDLHPPQTPQPHFIQADLRDRAKVRSIFELAEAVCHLGEIPTIPRDMPPEDLYAHNTRIASVVLQAAADLRLKRMIYTSSAQVYGAWGSGLALTFDRLPMDETHPLRPRNAYSLAKLAAEQYAQVMAERFGLSVAAFRFPWVEPDEPDERYFRHLETDTRPSEGAYSYVHVTDAARAYALALEHPRPGFQAYHFSAEDVRTLVPIRQRLLQDNRGEPELPADWPDHKSPILTDKAREHFGWRAQWSILERYHRWVRSR